MFKWIKDLFNRKEYQYVNSYGVCFNRGDYVLFDGVQHKVTRVAFGGEVVSGKYFILYLVLDGEYMASADLCKKV